MIHISRLIDHFEYFVNKNKTIYMFKKKQRNEGINTSDDFNCVKHREYTKHRWSLQARLQISTLFNLQQI